MCSSDLMILTMALCGLWHGPSWTFVLWGTVHGCAIVVVTLWRRYGWSMPTLPAWIITVVFGVLSAVIFRAGSLEAIWRIYEGLAILPNLDRLARGAPVWIATACALLLPASQDIVAKLNERPRTLIAVVLGLVVVAVLVELGDRDAYEFVYFQF